MAEAEAVYQEVVCLQPYEDRTVPKVLHNEDLDPQHPC